MIVHLVLNEYTFCGKHIDSLRTQDSIILIKSNLDDDAHMVSRFKNDPCPCKLCLSELGFEECLVFKKQNINNEEIDEPVI